MVVDPVNQYQEL